MTNDVDDEKTGNWLLLGVVCLSIWCFYFYYYLFIRLDKDIYCWFIFDELLATMQNNVVMFAANICDVFVEMCAKTLYGGSSRVI